MSKPVFNPKEARRLAGYELNGLLLARVLPREVFQNGRFLKTSTPIYDLNGDILFYRYPMIKGRSRIGYADIAASPAFAQPLLAVTTGLGWNARELIREAKTAARKHKVRYTAARFVAYSYPKVAVQFLSRGRETLMLELFTWQEVPPSRGRYAEEPPGNFERWSLLDETPANRKEEHETLLRRRLQEWEETLPRQATREPLEVSVFDTAIFEEMVKPQLLLKVTSRELHYSLLDSDHLPCYELRGQLTSVWCVAASMQMVLDFYRHNYAQDRIAADMGLGTFANPNGLPYGDEQKVVDFLQSYTSNCLSANLNWTPSWAEFVAEINQNRPLISFIPGHSRTVAGYTDTSLFGWHLFRGLLVYDPWPPTSGVITRWENFSSQTYRCTFSAHLTLV